MSFAEFMKESPGKAAPPPSAVTPKASGSGGFADFMKQDSAPAKPAAAARESALASGSDAKPSLLRQFFTPANTWQRGTSFGEDVGLGAAELGLGAATAARDAATMIPGKTGQKIESATEPFYKKALHTADELHQRGQGSLGEGLGFYGPMAALTPAAAGVAGTGAATNVVGNVLDPTKSGNERYGLANNAIQAGVGAVAGKGGAMIADAVPKVASGIFNMVKGLPARMKETGSVGRSLIGAAKEAGGKAASGAAKGLYKAAAAVTEADLPVKYRDLSPAERVIAKTAKAGGVSSKEANQIAQDARKHGINLPLFGILDDPNLTRYAQAVGSFSGGAKTASKLVKSIKEEQVPEAISNVIKGIGTQPGISPMEAGTALTSLVKDVYKSKESQLSKAAKPFYDKLRGEALPEELYSSYISHPEVRQAIDDVMKLYGSDTPGYPGLKSLVKEPSTELPSKMSAAQYQDFIKNSMTKEPNYNNLAIMNEVKKRLGAAGRNETDKYRGARLFDLSAMVGEGLKKNSENYRNAVKHYDIDEVGGEVRQMGDSIYKTLRDLHSDKADKAMGKLFSYSPEVITNVRNMLVDSGNKAAKDVWDNAMAGFMQGVFDDVVKKGNPFAFRKQLFEVPALQKQLKAALPERYDGLKEFFGVLEKTQETLQKLPTSMTAPLTQAQRDLGSEMGGDVAEKIFSKKKWVDMAIDSVRNTYINNVVKNPEGAKQLAQLLFSDEGLTMLKGIEDAPAKFKPAATMTLLENVGAVGAPAYLKTIFNPFLGGGQ